MTDSQTNTQIATPTTSSIDQSSTDHAEEASPSENTQTESDSPTSSTDTTAPETTNTTDGTNDTDERVDSNNMNDTDSTERCRIDSDGTMHFKALEMKCTHCDNIYSKTHDLYRHIRSHQNHTQCPHCHKILTCMATFVYHVRTHTGEKPYYCPVKGCDFENAVKYNLKVHLASMRHGGTSNLKTYAKVLDLDVCEESLQKRKDTSVYELGSRRTKRRKTSVSNDWNASTEHTSGHNDTTYGSSIAAMSHSAGNSNINNNEFGIFSTMFGLTSPPPQPTPTSMSSLSSMSCMQQAPAPYWHSNNCNYLSYSNPNSMLHAPIFHNISQLQPNIYTRFQPSNAILPTITHQPQIQIHPRRTVSITPISDVNSGKDAIDTNSSDSLLSTDTTIIKTQSIEDELNTPIIGTQALPASQMVEQPIIKSEPQYSHFILPIYPTYTNHNQTNMNNISNISNIAPLPTNDVKLNVLNEIQPQNNANYNCINPMNHQIIAYPQQIVSHHAAPASNLVYIPTTTNINNINNINSMNGMNSMNSMNSVNNINFAASAVNLPFVITNATPINAPSIPSLDSMSTINATQASTNDSNENIICKNDNTGLNSDTTASGRTPARKPSNRNHFLQSSEKRFVSFLPNIGQFLPNDTKSSSVPASVMNEKDESVDSEIKSLANEN